MKLSTNTYQRFLWIAASACLLGIVGCSDLPRTASSNNTAMYGTNGGNLHSVRVTGLRPKAYDPYADTPPAPFGSAPAVPGGGGFGTDNGHSAPAASSSSTSASSTASSGTASGGHSGGK
jgi:hypothetical protein